MEVFHQTQVNMQKRKLLLSIGAFVVKPAWALYDPKPHALLMPAVGSWRGSLVYADYQSPDQLVTAKPSTSQYKLTSAKAAV